MKCSTLQKIEESKNIANYDKALGACNLSINLDPNSAETYNVRGTIKSAKGDYSAAIEDFQSAISLSGELNSVYYYNRGLAYNGNNNIDLAIEDFTTAIYLDHTDVDYYIYRAEAYVSKGDFDSAFQDYEKVMEIDRGNTAAKDGLIDARNARAKSRLDQGEFQSAVADYKEALKRDPSDDDAKGGLRLAQRLVTQAEVEICNETSSSATVAIVADRTVSNDTNLIVDGWSKVAGNDCRSFGFFPRQKPMYIYARQGARAWGEDDDGLKVCIKDKNFHRPYRGSEDTCGPKEEKVNFFEVTIDDSEAKHSVPLPDTQPKK
jgi:tetratricopeptide (TPR) repeat protein